jgi:hypothetical protein
MRRRKAWPVVTAVVTVGFCAATASAGIIADENAKPGADRDWPVRSDGTAAGAGVVDVYPSRYSIKQGESIALKIRSTTGYSVRILRLGWYGGKGSREIAKYEGRPADEQPYPTPESAFGLAEAKWHDSVTVTTDSAWTPGAYLVRVERPDGREAETFFFVRDDALEKKMPILFVASTATHQAYNAWPGKARGGKSLYDFNSAAAPVKGSLYDAAVKVSFDRPFLVGGGTADLAGQEYPAIRFFEKEGWEVGYATDQDLHLHPEIMLGRKAVFVVGHAEYWSRPMFDGALAARDAGVHFFFMTGNTLGWQIRYEDGAGGEASTVVGYKNSFVRDPEQKLAAAAKARGDIEEAKKHYRLVTRGWRQLENDPAAGIDVRQPSMVLTGIQSTAMMGTAFPWGDLQITNPTHWLFEGTGVKLGDRIAGVMGYEVDSTKKDDPSWDPFRPAGQTRLGTIRKSSDDSAQGSAGYYARELPGGKRAEVVAIGAIAFSWALDGYAHGSKTPESDVAKQLVRNAVARWTSEAPIADPGPGVDEDPSGDPSVDPVGPDTDQGGPSGGTDGTDGTEDPGATPERQPVEPSSSGGCSIAGSHAGTTFGLAALAAVVALCARRGRRRRGTHLDA